MTSGSWNSDLTDASGWQSRSYCHWFISKCFLSRVTRLTHCSKKKRFTCFPVVPVFLFEKLVWVHVLFTNICRRLSVAAVWEVDGGNLLFFPVCFFGWFVFVVLSLFQARSFSPNVPAAATPAFLQTVSLKTVKEDGCDMLWAANEGDISLCSEGSYETTDIYCGKSNCLKVKSKYFKNTDDLWCLLMTQIFNEAFTKSSTYMTATLIYHQGWAILQASVAPKHITSITSSHKSQTSLQNQV